MVVIGVCLLVLAMLGWWSCVLLRLERRRDDVETAWANVEVEVQRRFDLELDEAACGQSETARGVLVREIARAERSLAAARTAYNTAVRSHRAAAPGVLAKV